MSADEFKIGDIVTLKSGSPPMTVTKIKPGDDGDQIRCEWCGMDADIRTYYFVAKALVHDTSAVPLAKT
jgi:uncharacterized protein YodC (DUF2158 family)